MSEVPALRFKKENGSSFSNWEESTVGEAFQICNSLRHPISTLIRSEIQGEYPYYGPTGILDFINEYRIDGKYALIGEDGDHFLKFADKSMTLLVEGKFNVNNHAHLLQGSSKTITEWFYYYFMHRHLTPYLTRQGVGRYKLTKAALEKLPVKIAPLPEQQKIASFLTAVDEKISKLQRELELLQIYKRGVMQKLFSQEIRFKQEDGSSFPDWEETKLDEVTEVNPRAEALPNSFFYIDLESVNDGALGETKELSNSDAPSRAQRTLRSGDILFQTVRPYQRNNLFFDLHGVYVASTGYAQLRTNGNAKFLYQLLHTDKFVNNVLARCTGTSYPAINSSDLASIPIKIPKSVKEQQKIATFLSAIDNKLDAANQQISLTEQFKKGLLQQMFV